VRVWIDGHRFDMPDDVARALIARGVASPCLLTRRPSTTQAFMRAPEAK